MPWIDLKPGDLAVDYATPKDLVALKRQGYRAVARYLWDGWKGLTAHELQSLLSAGFGVWGIYESTVDRAFLGAAAGTADGKYARTLADRIGFHGGIIWTLDTDANKATAPAVIAYGRAFAVAARAPQTGAYVDGDVCELMTGPEEFCPVWRPGAGWWSRFWTFGQWKNTHPYTHITQLPGVVPGTDHGVVLRPCRVWAGDDKPVTPVGPAPWVPAPVQRLGSFGPRTGELQQVLAFWGYYKVRIDKFYGPATRRAVIAWQKALKVPATGVYDVPTANAYRDLLVYFASLKKA